MLRGVEVRVEVRAPLAPPWTSERNPTPRGVEVRVEVRPRTAGWKSGWNPTRRGMELHAPRPPPWSSMWKSTARAVEFNGSWPHLDYDRRAAQQTGHGANGRRTPGAGGGKGGAPEWTRLVTVTGLSEMQ